MGKFQTVTYEIHNRKIKNKEGVRFAFLADLHGSCFGEDNADLLGEIDRYAPDAVLIAGDMAVRMEPQTLETAQKLLEKLAVRYPVFYGPGNHESKMSGAEHPYRNEYLNYEAHLNQVGISVLCNEKKIIQLGEDYFTVNGLELPLEYYHKPFSPRLTKEKMEELIGCCRKEEINILLAHNPKYGKTYFTWGADLILSGHYHGGVIRFSRHIGAISSQFIPFPRYCCGDFYRGEQGLIVSPGLGEHTIPLRIHNPRELILINMKP